MQVTWSPIWEPKEQMDVWESFKEKVEEFEAEQVTPPLDLELDNLERQGFQVNSEGTYQWQSTATVLETRQHLICSQPIHK